MAMKKKSRKFSKKKSRKLNKKKCGRGTRFKRVMRGGNNISYDITDEHRKIELKFTPFFTSCKIRFYVNDKIRVEGDVTNETRLTLSSNEDNLTIRKPKLNLKAQTETTKFTLKQLYNDLIYVKLFMITNNDLNNKTSKASLQQKDIDSLNTLIEEAEEKLINLNIRLLITERLNTFKELLKDTRQIETHSVDTNL